MSALDDLRLLRDEQGRTAASIDWDRVLTINYRTYVEPDALVVDAGAGDGVQTRRLRRYVRPSQVYLVESDQKAAAKLRFEWARKRGVTVVQVALGSTATKGEAFDVDRLDDWTLPSILAFLRVGPGVATSWPSVVEGATNVIRRDRPVVGLEAHADPDALISIARAHEMAIVDLLGNVVGPDEVAEVVSYQPAVVLIPAERTDRLQHERLVLRGDVLRSITNYSRFRERLKRLIGA